MVFVVIHIPFFKVYDYLFASDLTFLLFCQFSYVPSLSTGSLLWRLHLGFFVHPPPSFLYVDVYIFTAEYPEFSLTEIIFRTKSSAKFGGCPIWTPQLVLDSCHIVPWRWKDMIISSMSIVHEFYIYNNSFFYGPNVITLHHMLRV